MAADRAPVARKYWNRGSSHQMRLRSARSYFFSCPARQSPWPQRGSAIVRGQGESCGACPGMDRGSVVALGDRDCGAIIRAEAERSGRDEVDVAVQAAERGRHDLRAGNGQCGAGGGAAPWIRRSRRLAAARIEASFLTVAVAVRSASFDLGHPVSFRASIEMARKQRVDAQERHDVLRRLSDDERVAFDIVVE